jgi:hypothetical protein
MRIGFSEQYTPNRIAPGSLDNCGRDMKKLLLAIGALLVAAYGFDYGLVKLRSSGSGKVFEDIRVDQLYTSTNKWKQVEWSRGNPVRERCVYSLLPHFGYVPCWYLKRHTMRITNTD